MADEPIFSDDISALWGVPEGDWPEPPRWTVALAQKSDDPDAVPANGNQLPLAADRSRDEVARLAEAIAGHHSDHVRRAELDAVRAEMEEAFAHQLAVALFELLSASNDRFAAVEDRLGQRIEDVVERITRSVGDHAGRLAASLDAATVDLAAIEDRRRAPVDAFARFQRDIRHEVGRLGDLVGAQGAEVQSRSAAQAEHIDSRFAQLSERLERSETRAAEALGELGTISQQVSALQDDVAHLREALDEVRRAVEQPDRKARAMASRRSRPDRG